MRVIGVPVGSLVGIGGLYKMMTSSSSFDNNDNKVVEVGGVVGANAGMMSRRLKTRSDFDQYLLNSNRQLLVERII